MAGFEDARTDDTTAIPWLGADLAARYVKPHGAMLDEELAKLKAGRVAWLPEHAPPDALEKLVDIFKIPRFPGESDEAYDGRLLAVWETWAQAGLPQGIVASLNAYGIVDAAVYRFDDGHFSSAPDWFSMFWVVIGPEMPFGPLLLDDFDLDAATLGSTATSEDVRAVKGQSYYWKASHALFVKVILRFPGDALLDVDPILLDEFDLGEESDDCQWDVANGLLEDTLESLDFTLDGYNLE